MKICVLIPIYMSENSRDINKKNLEKLKKTEFKFVDEVIVCDQEFQPEDYIDGFTYLGPYKKFTYGLAQARNILLKHFYNSDYDYAVLMDARENISKSGLNSFATLCDLIHKDKINLNFILPSIGMMVSQERMNDKQRIDYKENICLQQLQKPHLFGLHHNIISNFKKKYNLELYIDEKNVNSSGSIIQHKAVFEDMYLQRLIGNHFNTYQLADMSLNLGPQKASIWAPNGGESLKGVHYKEELDKLVAAKQQQTYKKYFGDIYFKRIEEYRELLTEYKPRKKKK